MQPSTQLNLGCGNFPIPGTLGVDMFQSGNTHVIADLSAPALPFKTGSIKKIYSYHVLEHLDFVRLMREIHRVLVDDGTFIVRVPHASLFCFWDDPTHIRPFTSRTFDYWEPKFRIEYGFPHFRVVRKELHFLGNPEVNKFKILPWVTNSICWLLNYLANLRIRLCERLWAHYVGGFTEIEFELRKA